MSETCSVDGCDRPKGTKGFCFLHYKRFRRHGDPLAGRVRINAPADVRFWARVTKGPDCWIWTGRTSWDGYGFHWAGKYVRAHRFAYELLTGPIPDGLVLDHLCRNRLCVNPDHLEPVTNRENILRGVSRSANNAAKTHCQRGHEFTPENTYHPPKAPDVRQCRICRRIARRASAQRRAS